MDILEDYGYHMLVMPLKQTEQRLPEQQTDTELPLLLLNNAEIPLFHQGREQVSDCVKTETVHPGFQTEQPN